MYRIDGGLLSQTLAEGVGLEEALKEKGLDKEFQLKAVPCSGIEACEVALLKAKRGVLDGNFIEGMACDGGCVQGGRLSGAQPPQSDGCGGPR